MKLSILACVALAGLSGCLWANSKSDSATGYGGRVILDDGGHLEGAAAHVEGGFAGLYVDGELETREIARPDDPATYRAVGVGLSMRGSLLGIIASEHPLERYFDFGAEAGVGAGAAFGVPPRGITATASGWVGAWVELGTVPAGPRYLAITANLRREAFAEDPWFAQTQLMLGLAYRHRAPLEQGAWNFHD